MFHRRQGPVDPVELRLGRKKLVAERGEPIAVSLLAAGEAALARSPKLHRPRGPSCLRGDCDGCLARVDGVPNVMTCLKPCRGGERVVVQNVLGSAKTDLLRLTDWFFPKGIDHHKLMAGVPAVGDVMQTVARQLAGIGRLPDVAEPPRPATRRAVRVLVIGGGLAGLSVAAGLAKRGLDVHVVDEGDAPGGGLRFADAALAREVATLAKTPGLTVHRATAHGVYDGEVLTTDEGGATVWNAEALVFATGAHDGALACPGNDVPGVMSARAVMALSSYGVEPTGKVVVVGRGFWAERLADGLGKRLAATLTEDAVAEVAGQTSVRAVTTKEGAEIDATVVALALPGAPAFELAAQAGAALTATDGGFAIAVDAVGRAGPSLWAVGECTGAPPDPARLRAMGVEVAADVARALGGQPSSTDSKSASPPTVKTKPKSPSKRK